MRIRNGLVVGFMGRMGDGWVCWGIWGMGKGEGKGGIRDGRIRGSDTCWGLIVLSRYTKDDIETVRLLPVILAGVAMEQ